jgi:hypothetical protein
MTGLADSDIPFCPDCGFRGECKALVGPDGEVFCPNCKVCLVTRQPVHLPDATGEP